MRSILVLLSAAPAAAFRLPYGHARGVLPTTPTHRPARNLPTMAAGAEPTEETGGGGVRTLEVWEKYNFATNKAFWRDLRRSVYDGEVSHVVVESGVRRFEQAVVFGGGSGYGSAQNHNIHHLRVLCGPSR